MTSPASTLSLSDQSIASFGSAIDVPCYDRAELRAGIVHIGVGGFHRAHLATYADELAALGHQNWAITGCGVLASDTSMAETLRAQDGLYTLIVRGADSTTVRLIGSIVEFIHATPDATAAVGRIAHPDTQIVSLTITEGGYPIDDITGDFLPNSPQAGSMSAFGILAAGLEQRRATHATPVTVMSCDNIMSNGRVARTATLGEAARIGTELVEWIDDSVTFPNSMVDRITPATSDVDRAWLAESHGIIDRWPVVTEPFRQWVVEDRFAGARLPLEDLDVIITDDVEPYEFMKLRLLNAAHSTMAYLSALMDIELVDSAMTNPLITRFLRRFLEDEAKPVLPAVAGIDVDAYIETLLGRFENPAIHDQIARLCLDGSAKFPKFLIPTIRAQVESDGPVQLSALALAGWCHYLLGRDDAGRPIDLAADPMLDVAVAHARESLDDPTAFLEFTAVFDGQTAGSESFRAAFTGALTAIRADGAAGALASTLGGIDESDVAS